MYDVLDELKMPVEDRVRILELRRKTRLRHYVLRGAGVGVTVAMAALVLLHAEGIIVEPLVRLFIAIFG